jgi:membrane protein implicated in regulation of membrane protease activity
MTDSPLRPKLFAVVAGSALLLETGPCDDMARGMYLTFVGFTLLSVALAAAAVVAWRRFRKNRDTGRDVIGIWRKPEKDKSGDDK